MTPGIGLGGELAVRPGEQVAVADLEEPGLGLRPPHVAKELAVAVDALADEVQVLLHPVDVGPLGDVRVPRRPVQPLDVLAHVREARRAARAAPRTCPCTA